MPRDLVRFPAGRINPMHRWQEHASPWRSSWNFIVLSLARYMPFTRAKNAMYRSVGMKVGPNASIGLMAMFDVFFPHLISVGDNSVIGYNSTILAHEFLVREWRKGPVRIGSNVLVGANTTVLAGVSIGDGSTVGAGSVVISDIPPNEFWAGVPARFVKKVEASGETL